MSHPPVVGAKAGVASAPDAGALGINGGTFVSCTAFTVDEEPGIGSIINAPPRSIDRQIAIDRSSDVCS